MKTHIKLFNRLKILFVIHFLFNLLLSNNVNAQASPTAQLTEVYKKYDSIKYITFDIKYKFDTDTIQGDFKHEEIDGFFTMAGKKSIYRVGDIEYMQNDNFLITVHNTDKLLLVMNPSSVNSGSNLPMRTVIDSLLGSYSQYYSINTFTNQNEVKIEFTRIDSMAQYNKFFIKYDNTTKFITAMEYEYVEAEYNDPVEGSNQPPKLDYRKKKFAVLFSNYRLSNFSEDLYKESNYIWFENGECKPVNKYNNYKIYYSKSEYGNSNSNSNLSNN